MGSNLNVAVRRSLDAVRDRRRTGCQPYDNQAFWTSHASLTGSPAVVAPIGRTPDGLPAGAQIVGPLYEDGTALAFAELLGDVIGGYEPPPV